jgi:hypothetical protein
MVSRRKAQPRLQSLETKRRTGTVTAAENLTPRKKVEPWLLVVPPDMSGTVCNKGETALGSIFRALSALDRLGIPAAAQC